MNSISLLMLSLVLSLAAQAQTRGLFLGSSLQPVNLPQALSQVQPGSVVLIGENHGLKTHQRQQLEIMTQLRLQGLNVSVGLEFFTYTDQPQVDLYRQGVLSEGDFLKKIAWGSPSFDFYRDQAQFPILADGAVTWALNAPRALTGKVAKEGLSSLTKEESSLLPPLFQLGRDSYRRRFLAMMPHLPSPEAGERYFAAQSIWDDTMAWRAGEFLKQHPQQVLVIVVGDFHVQYGGGLPDRLRSRLPGVPVLTFSQINSANFSAEELRSEMEPSVEFGPRADFMWVEPAL